MHATSPTHLRITDFMIPQYEVTAKVYLFEMLFILVPTSYDAKRLYSIYSHGERQQSEPCAELDARIP